MIHFRFAKQEDVSSIVAMLADDVLGSKREQESQQGEDTYLKAFEEMQAQAHNNYLLALDVNDAILGCLQLTIIPGLSRAGTKRAQIEGVRVLKTARGLGIGKKMMDEAHAIARQQGCGLVQLTTDRSRKDAHRFYEELGYEKSHHGLKLAL